MKTMLIAFVSIVVIAVIADQALNAAGFSAADIFSLDSVRLGG